MKGWARFALWTALLVGAPALTIISWRSWQSAENLSRLQKVKLAVKDLCLGMAPEAAMAVAVKHGITPNPYPGRDGSTGSFTNAKLTVFDYLNPDNQITTFNISAKSGLWLVRTKSFHFFLDEGKEIGHDLAPCGDGG